jgi:hypothetical protein
MLRPGFRRLLALAGLFGAVLAASPAISPAQASGALDWQSLRPAAAAADNPFARLTPQQTDWITEIALARLMQARGRPASNEVTARQAALSAALASEGLDAEALLRQRDALIEKRKAAAQTPVPAVAGRAVRLAGYLVPASADGATVTDWLFVPWAAVCSHTPMPANQIVRIPAKDLPEAHRYGMQPLVLTGRINVHEQQSRLRLVDGELPLRSAYVVADPTIHPQQSLATFSERTGAPSP